jgi:hypothetical protein
MMNYRTAFAELLLNLKHYVGNRPSKDELDRVASRLYEAPFGKFRKFPNKMKSELDELGELVSSPNLPSPGRIRDNTSYMSRNNHNRNFGSPSRSPNSRRRQGIPLNSGRSRAEINNRLNTGRSASKVDLSPGIQTGFFASQNTQRSTRRQPQNLQRQRGNVTPEITRVDNRSQSTMMSHSSQNPIIFPPANNTSRVNRLPTNHGVRTNYTPPKRYKKPEIIQVVTPEKNKSGFQLPTFTREDVHVQPPINQSDPNMFKSELVEPIKQGPHVQMVGLRDVQFQDRPDAVISNKESYFLNHGTERIQIPEGIKFVNNFQRNLQQAFNGSTKSKIVPNRSKRHNCLPNSYPSFYFINSENNPRNRKSKGQKSLYAFFFKQRSHPSRTKFQRFDKIHSKSD